MKEEVSASYLETVKRNFGNEAKVPSNQNRSALIVGTDRPGSIGRAVVDGLANAEFSDVWAPPRQDFDVTRIGQMKEWFHNHDLIDTLVLCHGITHLAWFEDQLVEDIVNQVEVNLTGTMLAIKAFVDRTYSHRHIRKHIVVVGSMAYRNVLNGSTPYCVSKAGVAHLIRCLGWELTPKGYFIWAVHPSNVQNTPMAEDTIRGIMEYRDIDREAAEAYWGAVNLMPRWLRAPDVAGTIVDLLTNPTARWQSGTNIELTGGQR